MPKKPTPARKQTRKAAQTTHQPRRLAVPKRMWYNPLTWHHRPPVPAYKPLPKARRLFAASLRQLWHNKRLFGGIVFVYGALNLLLVRSLSGSDNLMVIKQTMDAALHGVGGKILTSVGGFSYLLTTSGSGSTAQSGPYQLILFFVCSLAFIWALRQTVAKHKVNAKDSFYHGMYPLVPLVLVFCILMLQFLPFVVGSSVYSTVTANGIAIHAWEKLLWLGVFLALTFWSLRMVTATLFAAYIVTLPDMTPLRALRSAKQLVYGRRLLLLRKLIFLPIVLLLLAVLIEAPLILFATPLAPWVFFGLSMLALPIVHSYLYGLYREMI